MAHIVSLKGNLNPQDAKLLARANQLRERAESVRVSLEAAPSDGVEITYRNEGLGAYDYRGKIGQDGFATANASLRQGKVEAFAAHHASGETLKFHQSTTVATGLRAGMASALGAVGGGLGKVAAWCLGQAVFADTRLGRSTMDLASRSFLVGRDAVFSAQHFVADPGTKDDYYALSGADGSYEQFRFTANQTLEHDFFPPKQA